MKTRKFVQNRFLIVYVVFALTAVSALIGGIISRNAKSDEKLDSAIDYREVLTEEAAGFEGSVFIPLPVNYVSSQVRIISEPFQKSTEVVIEGVDSIFYHSNPLLGNREHVERILYGFEQGRGIIKLLLDDVLVCRENYVKGGVVLDFISLSEFSGKKVLLDAGHGGDEPESTAYGVREAEVDLKLCVKLMENLKQKGMMAYLTRNTDMSVTDEEKRKMAEEVDADVIISVHCNADAKSRVTKGIVVSSDGSAEGADIAGRAASALGGIVFEENVNTAFDGMGIPVVLIKAGYLTNRSEAEKLMEDEYLESMAEKIVSGII